MSATIGELTEAMIAYERGIPKRINHFMKVYAYAKMIGEFEKLSPEQQNILEIAAIVHDIGIRPSIEKYQSDGGRFQQIEGPPVAEEMLDDLGFPQDVIDRVCWLIANHHTYDNITELDHRILVEADFIVNLYEDKADKNKIMQARKKYFRTAAGIRFITEIFALPPES